MALPKPSNALLKKCKTNKLKTPMHKAFCDLILAGWEKEDAYAFSGLWNPTYSTLMNIQDMNHLLKEDIGVVEYIDTRVKELELLKKKAKRLLRSRIVWKILSKKTPHLSSLLLRNWQMLPISRRSKPRLKN